MAPKGVPKGSSAVLAHEWSVGAPRRPCGSLVERGRSAASAATGGVGGWRGQTDGSDRSVARQPRVHSCLLWRPIAGAGERCKARGPEAPSRDASESPRGRPEIYEGAVRTLPRPMFG